MKKLKASPAWDPAKEMPGLWYVPYSGTHPIEPSKGINLDGFLKYSSLEALKEHWKPSKPFLVHVYLDGHFLWPMIVDPEKEGLL